MVVRAARRDDAESIERIRIRGWQVGYRHLYPPGKLDGLELDWSRWRRRIEHPPAGWTILVAEGRGRVLGFLATGPSRDEPGVGELYAIYVDPDEWRRGAGRALIEHGERRLAEEYAEATLWVLEENPRARRFYEAAGWQADGGRQVVERLGVSPPEVRYRKRFRAESSG
jgi:ribosomal protein S18 acetylase RimI-like enzyme